MSNKYVSNKLNSEEIVKLVKPHLNKLLLKKKQLVRIDDYGNVDEALFDKELNYFISKNINNDPLLLESIGVTKVERDSKGNIKLFIHAPNNSHISSLRNAGFSDIQPLLDGLGVVGLKVKDKDATLALKTVRDLIFAYENNTQPKVRNLDDVSPIDFEHECADLLNQTGWMARVTQASGDQGIDVIATYGNMKAVFQVKKYSQPVGNSAVQEIIAGKAFEQAHVAAVVTNVTYTASAKQLAGVTGVFLLHYSELPNFAETLGLVEIE